MSMIRYRLTPRLLSWSCASFLLVLWLSPPTASAVNLTGPSLAPPNPTVNINDGLQLIASGSYDDGTRRCWGFNASGEFGNSRTIHSLMLAGIQQVSNTRVILCQQLPARGGLVIS